MATYMYSSFSGNCLNLSQNNTLSLSLRPVVNFLLYSQRIKKINFHNSLIIIAHQFEKKASNSLKVTLYHHASHLPRPRFIVVVKELVDIGGNFLEFCL